MQSCSCEGGRWPLRLKASYGESTAAPGYSLDLSELSVAASPELHMRMLELVNSWGARTQEIEQRLDHIERDNADSENSLAVIEAKISSMREQSTSGKDEALLNEALMVFGHFLEGYVFQGPREGSLDPVVLRELDQMQLTPEQLQRWEQCKQYTSHFLSSEDLYLVDDYLRGLGCSAHYTSLPLKKAATKEKLHGQRSLACQSRQPW